MILYFKGVIHLSASNISHQLNLDSTNHKRPYDIRSKNSDIIRYFIQTSQSIADHRLV